MAFSFSRPLRLMIKERLPGTALAQYAFIEAFAELQLAALPTSQREDAIAYILSVWACNLASTGSLALSNGNYTLLYEVGLRAAEALSHDAQSKVLNVMDEAKAKRLIEAD